MSAWIISVGVGLLTGLGLYVLVRLRMYLGPAAGRKFGVWGRRAVWILLIAGMVILAEYDLIWLRNRLDQTNASGAGWHYEAVYALLILVVGLILVFGRVLRRIKAQGNKHNNNRKEHRQSSRKSK